MSLADVIEDLSAVLAPLGFKRRKSTWNRARDPFVGVVDIQASKGGKSLALNVGVLDRYVYETYRNTGCAAFVGEVDCTVRARASRLIDDRDIWWPISDARSSRQIVTLLTDHGLPFIERMHSRDAMIERLTADGALEQRYPLPAIYVAILRHKTGDRQVACSVLNGLCDSVTASWRVKVDEVSARLGC